MVTLVVWEVLVILFMVLMNGFFSGAEFAILSANRGRLREWAEAGDERAQIALRLAENPSLFLPTIQVGITLAGTFAPAFGGAVLTQVLADALHSVPGRQEVALAIIVLAITVLTVLFGELVPKRVALSNPSAIARMVARPVILLSHLARPVIWCLGTATDAITSLFRLSKPSGPATSVQEIRHLIEIGTAEGVFDPVEQKLAFEALQLGDRIVRQIMKPRIDIDALDINTPPEVVLGAISMAGFSRLPVYEGDLDHIIGFVHLKDVLRQNYLGWNLELRKLVRPALIVPETMRLDQLLVRFQQDRNQLAVVVDEYGATRGMVTLEDVLEELVGELLTTHHERLEQLVVRRDDGSWLVDGAVSIADLLKVLNRPRLLPLAPRHVTSVGGLVLAQLGRMPTVGESVTWQELQLEVVDLDGRRIDRVLVTEKG